MEAGERVDLQPHIYYGNSQKFGFSTGKVVANI